MYNLFNKWNSHQLQIQASHIFVGELSVYIAVLKKQVQVNQTATRVWDLKNSSSLHYLALDRETQEKTHPNQPHQQIFSPWNLNIL